MNGITDDGDKTLLISTSSLVDRGEMKIAATIVDVRNSDSWDRSTVKIRGAARTDPKSLPLDPAWPSDGLLVFY